jgi:hypothetical protein
VKKTAALLLSLQINRWNGRQARSKDRSVAAATSFVKRPLEEKSNCSNKRVSFSSKLKCMLDFRMSNPDVHHVDITLRIAVCKPVCTIPSRRTYVPTASELKSSQDLGLSENALTRCEDNILRAGPGVT